MQEKKENRVLLNREEVVGNRVNAYMSMKTEMKIFFVNFNDLKTELFYVII